MKRLFSTISACALLLCGLAQAQDGGFAKAAEFGSPKLDLNSPQYLKAGAVRTWELPSGPIQAAIVALEGEWGRRATVQLRTEYGLQLGVPARNLRDADLAAVRQWLADNAFAEMETLRHGKVLCRILAVTELSNYELMVHLVQPDGRLHHWPVYRKASHPGERFEARPVPVTQKTLDMLHEHLKRQKELPAAPLTIAESVQEAAACAAIRGQSVVVLFLNNRGSNADKAFRSFLKQYPYASAHLSRRHVFLLAYRGEDGAYPTSLTRELLALDYQLNPQNQYAQMNMTARHIAEAHIEEQSSIIHGIHFMPFPYARDNEPNPSRCYSCNIYLIGNRLSTTPEKLDFNLQ